METTPLKRPVASLHPARIELGTGRGYYWASAWQIVTPDGSVLYPPMQRKEAIEICAREGWKLKFMSNYLKH